MSSATKQIYYKQNRLQQLRGFCHVVQTGSISKAAERMFLSQPSVSLQIQALERELIVVLFERNGPHLKLTPEGQSLYELARPLVDGMDNLYEHFALRHADANTGKLRIAVDPVVSCGLLNGALHQFVGEFPGVKVEMITMSVEDAKQALQSDEVDLVVSGAWQKAQEFTFHSLCEYSATLITSRKHPLAKRSKVTLEEMSPYSFISAATYESALQVSIEQTFMSYRLPYSVRLEIGELVQLKNAVRENLGIAIVPSICVERGEPFKQIDLSTYFPRQECGYWVRKGRFIAPQAKNFIEILQDLLKGEEDEGGEGMLSLEKSLFATEAKKLAGHIVA